MTPDDPIARAYVAQSVVARVATLSPRGRPALTPLWFVCDGSRLYTATGRATLAARNAAANPAVVVLLDGESAGRSAYLLRLRASATVHPGLAPLRVLARFAAKYYAPPWALRSELAHARLWNLRRRYYAQAEAVWIEIAPESCDLVARPA